MKCEIVNVGTELLLGDILNTNAQFLAQEISALGFDMYYQSIVGDNHDRLLSQIKESLSRSDILIVTGGLGPTEDDITKETVAEAINKNLVFDEASYSKMVEYFKNRKMAPSNKKQAYIPEGATILENDFGTAPGFLSEYNNKLIAVLPGPPRELIPMFNNKLKPHLEKMCDSIITSKFVKVFGVGESQAEFELKELIDAQSNPTIAPYAKTNEMAFRVTAKGKSEAENLKMIDNVIQKMYYVLGDAIYGFDNNTLEEIVVKELKEKNYTISFAESCTCGLLASKIGNVSGASDIFNESYVTYANSAKNKLLGVAEDTLEKFGAVSEETATEMSVGLKNKTGADIAVSVTGIAGPTGGTPEKPVGLVYIGITFKNKTKVYKLNLKGERQKIREAVCMHALNYVRLTIKEKDND